MACVSTINNNMERRSFFKNTLLATGSFLLGGAAVKLIMNQEEPLPTRLPISVEIIQQGQGKNVLVLMGSSTKHGNTDQLTDAYIKGVVERGYTVTKVYLRSTHLDGCRGCGVCQRGTNRCVIQDGMQELYRIFAQCDTLVMASPLYFHTITARLKAFIERLYAISVEDKYPVKDTVWLMTAGDDKEEVFDHVKQYFNIISNVFGGNQKGVYCAGDCTGCEKPAREIDKKHLDNAYQMGMEL